MSPCDITLNVIFAVLAHCCPDGASVPLIVLGSCLYVTLLISRCTFAGERLLVIRHIR